MRTDARLTWISSPAWSPDGATIAYTFSRLVRGGYFEAEIRTVPAAGGPSRTVIRHGQAPAWSPDGRRLAYSGIRDHNGSHCGSDECTWSPELYVANADGSGQTRLTRNKGSDERPAWSPDGTRLLFTSDQNVPDGDSWEVYSIGADGSCLTWLTNGTPPSRSAVFRPGSGDDFGPGSCDPNARPPLLDAPPPPPSRGGFWLGPRYRGLLFTRTDPEAPKSLSYDDCEHLDPNACPATVILSTEPACRMFTFRGLTDNAYRFLRRKGAIYAYAGEQAVVRVFSGATATSIQLWGGSKLPAVRQIIDDLRPLDAAAPPARLPAARIPRQLAHQLDATARSAKRHGTAGAARALNVHVSEVRRTLRLRELLRPYRIAAC